MSVGKSKYAKMHYHGWVCAFDVKCAQVRNQPRIAGLLNTIPVNFRVLFKLRNC